MPGQSPRSRPAAAGVASTVAGVVAVLVTACGPAAPSSDGATSPRADVAFGATTPEAAGQLEEAIWLTTKEPTSLDLDSDGANSHSARIMSNVCERLLQVQPDLSPQPHLAESYEWATPTTLVFQLRQDVVFHSGNPMTADDVVWSLRRHAADGASESDEYVNVETITKTGPYEVTIGLTQPDAVFVQALAGDAGIVLDRTVVEEQGDDYGTPSGTDACSGPFRLDSWRSGQEIVITKADDYWNPERAAKTGQVTFRWMSDDALVNSLTTGEATGSYLENISLAATLAEEGLTVSQGPDTRVWSLMVTERGGLEDVRLRRALSLAIDREGINTAGFSGLGQPWKEPVGSGAWSYETDAFEDAYDQIEDAPASPSDEDIAEATRLVEEAAPTQPVVVASDGTPIRNAIANAVVAAGQQIGLPTEIEQVSVAEYSEYYANPEARASVDMFADDYFVSKFDPVGFYKNGASDSSVQWLLADDDYDALVSQGRATLDDAERADVAIEMAARWAEAKPWISLVASPSTVAMSPEVTGVPSSGSYFYYPWAADLGSVEG
ncbi:ABC transporter substrate-binding protein [Myceligenerans pegani]|uniref:ABC transporter substrate-binding protein n=1 Tax=Myceligenerans pegani TaxID=2776917 RepID=A0ABR9N4F3_9MICO|nr:ABC transporter substrate-binding protein [Myceligenerans sp. TRM 65318]MBE1878552.1 ABC transporter substrate-binding protein [Myceligenerans sp. TRM 65318]MBE3020823.1 ABC transporter substrate-binding protein [Myceligenerans sp. TRM 65318]